MAIQNQSSSFKSNRLTKLLVGLLILAQLGMTGGQSSQASILSQIVMKQNEKENTYYRGGWPTNRYLGGYEDYGHDFDLSFPLPTRPKKAMKGEKTKKPKKLKEEKSGGKKKGSSKEGKTAKDAPPKMGKSPKGEEKGNGTKKSKARKDARKKARKERKRRKRAKWMRRFGKK